MSEKTKNKKDSTNPLYIKSGDTNFLYKTVEIDGFETQRDYCDYAAIKKIVVQLEPPHEVVCDVIFRQFNRWKEIRCDTGFLQKFVDSELCNGLIKSGYKRHLASLEDIALYFFKQYHEMERVFYRSKSLGWLEVEDGKNSDLVYIAGRIHGGNGKYPADPDLNPAYLPHGDEKAYWKMLNEHIINFFPTVLSLSIALGAILLPLYQEQLCNASTVISYVGKTSRGKSTNSRAAMSIMSMPNRLKKFDTKPQHRKSRSAIRDWMGTENGIMGSLKNVDGCVVVIEDVASALVEVGDGILYQLAEGLGKQRALVTGEPAERIQFCTLFLINSEESLVRMESKGGLFSRYFEVRLDNFTMSAEHSKALKAVYTESYAHVGPQFVDKTVELVENNRGLLDSVVETSRERLYKELRESEIEEGDLRYRLADSLCLLVAGLNLYNMFFATGANPKCKSVDVDKFTSDLAVHIVLNTKQNALNYNHQLRVGRILDFIKEHFYCEMPDDGDLFATNLNKGTAIKRISCKADFDTSDFDVYDSLGKRIGYKNNNEIAINTKFFAYEYNQYVNSYNLRNPANKITTTLIQYLKELKSYGILDCPNSDKDSRHYRERNILVDFKDEQKPCVQKCYVFRLDGAATGEPEPQPELPITEMSQAESDKLAAEDACPEGDL